MPDVEGDRFCLWFSDAVTLFHPPFMMMWQKDAYYNLWHDMIMRPALINAPSIVSFHAWISRMTAMTTAREWHNFTWSIGIPSAQHSYISSSSWYGHWYFWPISFWNSGSSTCGPFGSFSDRSTTPLNIRDWYVLVPVVAMIWWPWTGLSVTTLLSLVWTTGILSIFCLYRFNIRHDMFSLHPDPLALFCGLNLWWVY